MSTKINVRSPYILVPAASPLDFATATLKLYIYDGVLTTNKPASASYTIVKSMPDQVDYYFDISELARDYISQTSTAVWVEADLSFDTSEPDEAYDYIAVDGFTEFEDGINAQLSKNLMQSNTTIYNYSGQTISIPVFSEGSLGDGIRVVFKLNGSTVSTASITNSNDSDTKVAYATYAGDCDEARIEYYNSSEATWLLSDTITIEQVEECKYTPYKIEFVNKFGSNQIIYAFKKSVQQLNVTGDTYKANTLTSTPSYSSTGHQYRSYNVNGKEKITLNTGLVDGQNEVIREMLLSEDVWVDDKPVTPTTKSFTYLTSVNDGVINYTLEFDYAYDKVNSIR